MTLSVEKARTSSDFWAEFVRHPVAVIAAVILLVVIVLAVFAPLIAPQDPYDLSSLVMRDARRAPGYIGTGGYTHILGTDSQGRDLFSAILYGLRISLEMGLLAGAIAFSIGALVGCTAAYVGGRFEALVMRLVDLQLSFPAILLAFVVAALLGQGKGQLIVALVFSQYAYFVRTAHGAAAVERNKDYVEAALSVPMSGWFVVTRHILPNALPPLIVVATVQVASAISLEATLSFLGVGLPPTEPSLGMLISGGFQYLLSGRYWISIYPGVALIVLIMAINLVGDQVRSQLNPRLKR
ncbi:ABC transporter permease [Phyllobacterium myrsinacearum]|uniref:Peptide ABC transporter permease n=1 Tax=Phyllobacterium myrsinacearum TaxID=28101 RepID=A0A2S9JHE9_9HYPH|nr:ABC transporter permease [Phyllobacterium myrsinacearum]PRD52406.1 peptide ABC transporter permease [Phyllobacterium myrsinacearum]PWV92225.1 peptide/nickel transport system permease protein [Phyllobacterium myrsinacearum]RZS77678.1 peptide/nickel transport system permease protein [Phyllobacterium myrsinacearum]RZV04966.1 peptide/nickel transport system permease protein [Phyllobacterium myrsinacearum]